jgi:phosphoribosylamine-glycine ligase
MKIIVVTRKWGALGLATLMKRQGADVLCAYDLRELKDKDLAAAKVCGEGMVDKMPLEDALRKFKRTGALWVFDDNSMPEEADKLRKDGEKVLGTSGFAAKMENDRDYAAKMAKQAGMKLGETIEFTDYSLGIKYLKEHSAKAYVFKPYEGDPESTFVPALRDDPKVSNEELQVYIATIQAHDHKRPRFVLQERLHGIEVNFEIWVQEGKPLGAFVDIESKRKLTDDIGENIGCAGDFVFKVPITSRGVQQTVAKYLRLPELANFTGSVDANVIIVDGEYYFLENCFRFGYNAYPTMFYGLAIRPTAEILQAWVEGKNVERMFSASFASSLTLVCDHPQKGFPVLLRDMAQRTFCPYSVYQEGKNLAMAGPGWPDIGCVVESAGSMEAAAQRCLAQAQKVIFPDKGYRCDLADSSLDTLPVRRYRALQSRGLLR